MTGTKRMNLFIKVFMIITLLSAFLPTQPVTAADLFVCSSCTYTTIQSAINVASPGDTIHVEAGTYAEHVTIPISLTLVGADKATTIIDGGGSGIVVTVVASDVSISGFTIQNSGPDPNAHAGIGMIMATDGHVFNNILQANASGVALGGAQSALIENNQFYSNIIGVALSYYEAGGLTYPSTTNTIKTNSIQGSIHSGIYGDKDCNSNSIIQNQITSSVGIANGVYLWKSSANSITGNTINGNAQYGIELMGSANNSITENSIKGNLDGIRIRVSEWPEGAYPSYPNTIEDNIIFSNTNYDLYAEADVTSVDATPNYWGTSCVAPVKISGNVSVSPWYVDDSLTTTTDGLSLAQSFPTGATTASMNALLACAVPGSTFTFSDPGYAYPGGIMVGATQSDLKFLLNGASVGAGSPAFIIDGDDVTIQGPGVLDGAGSTGPGILVNAGADNFILDRVEVTGWQDGLELAGSVTSFKVVSSWFHENTESGLQIDAGVGLEGVVTIEGNLFKENGTTGIQNDSGTAIEAQYNSWGHIDGPAAGDTVSANVDATNWTFFEPYVDVIPDTNATLREVIEGDTFMVALKMDAAKLYGMSFKLTWNSTYLNLNTVTFASFWADKCTSLSTTPGEISYHCHLEFTDAQRDVVGDTILTMNFTTKTGTALIGNGPWESFFDIYHLEADTSAGAASGAKIWVNNAGFGSPSASNRDIVDSDDGKVIITGIANYSGKVILEGRTDYSGAGVYVFYDELKDTPLEMAGATSDTNGQYYTAHISPNVLMIGSTYYLFIDRDLYLPTTIMGIDDNIIPNPPIPTVWEHSKPLTMRLYTPLATVTLLGGDATNDDVIDILDAGCIGGGYGLTPQACGTGGWTDVNGDGVVNMLDVTLMAGNYTRNYSAWAP